MSRFHQHRMLETRSSGRVRAQARPPPVLRLRKGLPGCEAAGLAAAAGSQPSAEHRPKAIGAQSTKRGSHALDTAVFCCATHHRFVPFGRLGRVIERAAGFNQHGHSERIQRGLLSRCPPEPKAGPPNRLLIGVDLEDSRVP
jgi:hypothetical protein